MLELTMAAPSSHEAPAIVSKHSQNFTGLHRTSISRTPHTRAAPYSCGIANRVVSDVRQHMKLGVVLVRTTINPSTAASLQIWQLISVQHKTDRTRPSWHSFDESVLLQTQHHLVYRRWRNLEIALHVRLGRRAVVNLREIVDERQILTLLYCEFECHQVPNATPNVKPAGARDRFKTIAELLAARPGWALGWATSTIPRLLLD